MKQKLYQTIKKSLILCKYIVYLQLSGDVWEKLKKKMCEWKRKYTFRALLVGGESLSYITIGKTVTQRNAKSPEVTQKVMKEMEKRGRERKEEGKLRGQAIKAA